MEHTPVGLTESIQNSARLEDILGSEASNIYLVGADRENELDGLPVKLLMDSMNKLDSLAEEVQMHLRSSNGKLNVRGDISSSTMGSLRAMHAVNEVLFTRHGFSAKKGHGDIGANLLGSVLQMGKGTSALLAVIYIEVARRIGVPLSYAPLLDGSYDYFLLWPRDKV